MNIYNESVSAQTSIVGPLYHLFALPWYVHLLGLLSVTGL